MIIKDLIKIGLKKKSMTQQDLADALGYKSIGGIGNALRAGDGMSIRNAVRMLGASGCKLIVRFPDGMECPVTIDAE